MSTAQPAEPADTDTSPDRSKGIDSLDELGEEICRVAAQIAAVTAQWLLLIADFDAREGWAGVGMRSCAHWLNLHCGLSLGAAREHVRTARALAGLPAIKEAFTEGKLSYSKVRALTRVATPTDEAELTELARAASASQVERTVRAYRQVRRLDPADPGPELFVRWHWDDQGCLVAHLRLSSEDGARFVEALEFARNQLAAEDSPPRAGDDQQPHPTDPDVPAGTPDASETGVLDGDDGGDDAAVPGQQDTPADTDAGTDTASAYDTAGDGPTPSTAATGDTASGDPVDDVPAGTLVRPQPTEQTTDPSPPPDVAAWPPRPVKVVHAHADAHSARVDASNVPAGTSAQSGDKQEARLSWLAAFCELLEHTLDRTPTPASVGGRCQIVVHVDTATLATDRGELGQLEDGPALPPETIRRLACDAAVVAMLRGSGGEVLDVGRRTRAISPAIARALRVRDHGNCRFPGCVRRRRLHAHHVQHWAHGGRTALDNLVLLCPFHHRAVHEGGYEMLITGRQRFRFLQPSGQPVPNQPYEVGAATEPLADLPPDTLFPHWAGGRLDLHHAITSLLTLHNDRERRPAPDSPPDPFSAAA